MVTTSHENIPLTHQVPTATGVPAGIEQLFIAALMWAEPADAEKALDLVDDDDIADINLKTVLATLRIMVYCDEHYSPQLLMDRLTREAVKAPVLKALTDCLTSGAAVPALMDYAAAVVAAALRRKTADYGSALADAATSMAEDDLAPLCGRVNNRIKSTWSRLRTLRGEA